MPPYQPKDRRPIADVFRRTADTAVAMALRFHVSPDAISVTSIVFAGAAGACLAWGGVVPSVLAVVPAFCFLRLWCNMLDGMVAVAGGTANPRGELFNEIPDRISDTLVFAGLAIGGLANSDAAIWCALAALATAYVGTLGRAVGVRRQYGGMMSKPWRMVVVSVAAVVELVRVALDVPAAVVMGATVFDAACVIVLVGCIQTCVTRVRAIDRELAALRIKPD